jgi:hypothetical protein
MNERCTIALARPCARANETLGRHFWRRLVVDGRFLSTIVTINK